MSLLGILCGLIALKWVVNLREHLSSKLSVTSSKSSGSSRASGGSMPSFSALSGSFKVLF